MSKEEKIKNLIDVYKVVHSQLVQSPNYHKTTLCENPYRVYPFKLMYAAYLLTECEKDITCAMCLGYLFKNL